MIATLPREKMTVAEFLDWCDAQGGDDRFELVDGIGVSYGHYDDRRLVVHHRRSGVGPLETTFVSDGEIELVPPGIRLGVDQLFGEVDR